jgi:TonB family protein
MKNKFIYITLIISIVFHLWAINIFSNIFGIWEDQEKKEQSIISTKMVLLTSNSFSHPAGKIADQYFQQDKEDSEIIIAENIIMGQKKILVENIEEEKNIKIDGNLPKAEKMIEQQEPIGKKKIEKVEEENIVQEKGVTVLARERDFETIQPVVEIENEQRKSQDTKIIAESKMKGKDEIISNEKLIISEDLKEKMDTFQSSNSEKDQTNENNHSKQKGTPLDLTQTEFSGNQILPPEIISFHQPAYPENLRKREIEGRVQLKVLINKEGEVIEAEIHSTSGYQDFDRTAVQSVYKWQFEPAQFKNTKRDSWVLIPIVFCLQ